ncbi:hypothetical protein [Saccharothrix sp. NRRL B-16348]|uniref:hypothetical protein n=1 Tax=Saccharothrix sp. NRRL B-16348 TaxID=1415542 RepID=UPI000B102F9D|nr:hypothetical protein [Saccharothrix sp. NRRL B-16348]
MELTRKITASVGAAAVSTGLSATAVSPAGAATCPGNGWLDGLRFRSGANGAC